MPQNFACFKISQMGSLYWVAPKHSLNFCIKKSCIKSCILCELFTEFTGVSHCVFPKPQKFKHHFSQAPLYSSVFVQFWQAVEKTDHSEKSIIVNKNCYTFHIKIRYHLVLDWSSYLYKIDMLTQYNVDVNIFYLFIFF